MAKSICESRNVDYEYKTIGDGVSIEELKEMCPGEIRSVPQIFEDETYVGGFEQLRDRL